MLNFDVKRKINTLRDILVGKVPDPKAQVEQITIALIYKFMDDMDLAGAEFGGKRVFFAGDYEKYAFTQIMLPEHSAQDRLNLYAEGIDKMVNNADLPSLFRDILRGAYIPYRDPETLNRFLKEIAEFSYDNSEDLGNAFEYLLSIMGSQGDAGQFRTPRHIIDMMVEIVAPRKDETILDPACGTAGFLISAYKYIDAQNRDEEGKSTLSGEDKKRMAQNFAGYDISPDMVRLSRVNMYLHGFSNPQISEYDTLTSIEKWNENYDVILANPPFMTPKGGISPHNRYRVSAKRAEVLFVDYIAEHLNPTGRAAIVVPEGIVFQSQTAYKKLRQYLVEDNLLYAVISLPAGVFNPYSGVKTSILLIDKTLAKEKDSILFVKLNNDGFDLGAQRRAIKGSEVSEVIRVVKAYQDGKSIIENENVVVAEKAAVATQDYILVEERYKTTSVDSTSYPIVRLGDVCSINAQSTSPSTKGKFIYIDISAVDAKTNTINYANVLNGAEAPSRARRLFRKGDILLSTVRPNLKAFAHVDREDTSDCIASTGFAVIRCNDKVVSKYLYYLLLQENLVNQMVGMMGKGAYPSINQTDVGNLRFPLPPLSVQQEIVEEIEAYQKIIDGARQIVDNYRPTIKINSRWDEIDVGDMYDISYGVTISIPQNEDENGIKIISTAEVGLDGQLDLSGIRKVRYERKYEKFVLEPNTLLFNWRNAPKHVGKTAWFLQEDDRYISASFLLSMKNKNPDCYDNGFVWCALNNLREIGYFMRNARQAVNQSNFNGDQLAKTKLRMPNIDEQKRIMATIYEEMMIVEQNKRLIQIFEKKIQDKIAEVWGE